jgi:hypothetical protein
MTTSINGPRHQAARQLLRLLPVLITVSVIACDGPQPPASGAAASNPDASTIVSGPTISIATPTSEPDRYPAALVGRAVAHPRRG